MSKLKKIVEDKKLKSATRIPKYGMRKLSIGLVSCTLGIITLAAPNVVKAQATDSAAPTRAIEEKQDKPSPSENALEGAINGGEDKNKDKKDISTAPEVVEVNNNQLTAVSGNSNDTVENNGAENGVGSDSDKVEVSSEPVLNEANSQEEPPVAAQPTANEDTKKSQKPRDGVAKNDKGEAITKESGSLAADEANVGTYRPSDLENNGSTKVSFSSEDVNTPGKEGFSIRVDVAGESTGGKYGFQINADKKTGERTYNYINLHDEQRNTPKTEGDVLDKKPIGSSMGGKEVNYIPTEDAEIGTGRIPSLDYTASDETLNYINNHEHKNGASFGYNGKYVKVPGDSQFMQGSNFYVDFMINPYPNENKQLTTIKVAGETSVDKVPVKGGYIKTKARIENLLEEDYTRISSEVYAPDGTVIDPKEAQAILVSPDNIDAIKAEVGDVALGDIVFKMPKGALEDPASIFNNNKFNSITNLSARFFARPRTKAEFEAIVAESNGEYLEGKYYETGAGNQVIKHNGKEVVIDKQGIARYDHYNNIGEITINLDDTKYYDQSFGYNDENNKHHDTNDHTSMAVKPGEKFEVSMYTPNVEKKAENQKTAEQMKEAEKAKEATGKINTSFIDSENKKIAKELGKTVDELEDDEKWVVNHSIEDITKFSIIPPKTAEAGDFVAIPVEYKYTNGSTDTHWFHFVVQANDNYKPEYHAETGYQGDKITKLPEEIPNDTEKNKPISYELMPGTTKNEQGETVELEAGSYKDSAGNIWTGVSIDSKTGAVTAIVPKNVNIKGGENLYIPVKVNYENGKEEYIKAQFIARPKYQAEVVFTEKKDIPFETEEIIDKNLTAGEIVVDEEGEAGEATVTYKQVVLNGKIGIIDKNGKFIEGDDKFVKEENVTKEKKNRKVRVGVKPIEETVEIPKTVEYIFDDTKPAGEETVEFEGSNGIITLKTSKDPNTGKVTITKTTTIEAKPKKIRRGTMVTGEISHTENKEIPFEVEVIEDENLEAGKSEIVTKGVPGSKTTKYTQKTKNGQADGEIVKEELTDKEVKPIKQVIRVGKKSTSNQDKKDKEIPVEIEFVYDKEKPQGTAVTGELIPGKAETTVTNKYNPESGKIETNTELVVTPAKQKIIVGTKDFTGEITHTEKEEIAFEVEVRENKDLDQGSYKVIQEGKPGEKEVTYTQGVKNGKAEGELKTTEKTTKEPKKHIIEIGTKNTCSVPPINPGTENPDKPNPGKPENPDKPNPNKPVNPDKENPGTDQPDNPKPEKPNSPKPGTNTPDKPINPSPEKPRIPEESTPNKAEEIGPKDSENKNPALVENKENSKVEKVEEAKAKNEDSKEAEVKEEDNENSPKYKDLKTNAMQGNKVKSLADNPKTYDAGIGGYAAITGLASSLLAAFEMKRRKKK